MADVKWIKITTDIFDDEKILLIESLPDAYAIITVWFKLLCLAGKQNNSGVFLLGRMPYNEQMLATIFRMKESTVTMAIQTFQNFGMVEVIDGVITIPNWGKHQNLDQLESKKAYMRNYMQGYREKQKALTSGDSSCKTNCKTNSKANVSSADKDIEEEGEEDIRKRDKKKTPKESNTTLFERLYPDFTLSDALIAKIGEWMKYKSERKDEYTEQGMRSLLRRIENIYLERGKRDKEICDLIEECMGNNWKGIIFDKLKAPSAEKQGSFDTNDFFNAALKKSYSKLSPREALERGVAERMEAPKATASDPELQKRAEELRRQLNT